MDFLNFIIAVNQCTGVEEDNPKLFTMDGVVAYLSRKKQPQEE